MFYLQKNLWRVWKLRIITKTTPKPLDLTSNDVKTRNTIATKLQGAPNMEYNIENHLIFLNGGSNKIWFLFELERGPRWR